MASDDILSYNVVQDHEGCQGGKIIFTECGVTILITTANDLPKTHLMMPQPHRDADINCHAGL